MFRVLKKWLLLPKRKKTKKLTVKDTVDLFFILSPYINIIREIKSKYNESNDLGFIIKTLINGMNKDDLLEAFSIILEDNKNVEDMLLEDFIYLVPGVIKENKLVNLYYLFKSLGLFDGR